MIHRVQSLLMGLTALLITLLWGLAPVQANTALGAYQADHQIAPGDQHAIHLTALGNFDYHAKTASECCNAPNNADVSFTGGPHRETSQPVGDGLDSHHCPAKNCYQDAPISSADGPAIQMDPTDHRLTSSYGNSAEARAYRAEQQRLLNEARVQEAVQMDIDDIRRIEAEIGQPGKYDTAIQQMQNYATDLDPNDFISP